jgi:hypothetical protein
MQILYDEVGTVQYPVKSKIRSSCHYNLNCSILRHADVH